MTSKNLTLFKTDPTHSYACKSLMKNNFTSIDVKDINSGQTMPLDEDSVIKASSLQTRNLKVQAFLSTLKNMDIFMFSK